ncbi:pantoate--beta-alanine ligase [Nanchangia anserum]|uniref:pantoate--beta-alanine ligase (AMP-forming) n=1 Tax=Nanchangia anserum TaxID=2692125 RepID=A0A8I0GDK7_9ACTO|nr:pantoate--beta-alanine ligase [Nanchangia anserum]
MSEPEIQIIHERETLRETLAHRSGRVAMVLIQGPLHYRHLANIAEAARTCETIVAVALVSREQANYLAAPQALDRPVAAEAEHLERAGAAIYFVASVDDMFPYGAPMIAITSAQMEQLQRTSAYTDEYFAGVIHFYAKLINIARPSDIYVSQKDLQEVAALRQYVRDFDVDVEVHAVMLAREADGLAADPVNHELTEQQRTRALALSRALYRGVQVAASTGSAQAIVEATTAVLEEADGVDPIHVELLDPFTLSEASVERGTAVLLVVARVGSFTLSDNMLVVLRRS